MVSSCAALREEQIGDTDRSTRSSTSSSAQPLPTDQHQLRNNRRRLSIPDQQPEQQQQQQQQQQRSPKKKQQQQHVQPFSLWKFPEPTLRRSLPIETWPSTNKTLADFYRSFNKVLATSSPSVSHSTYTAGHHLRQSSASNSPSKHEAILHHALRLYKSLSDLQHNHGTVLIPPRHVRSLLLAVSRQDKTSAHLDHVLRLASDLIWLRSGQRQQRHSGTGSEHCAKQLEARSPVDGDGPAAFDLTRLQEQGQTQGPLPGLLVSEYTILMDWVGAFPANHETLQQQPWTHPTTSDLDSLRSPSCSSSSSASPDSGFHKVSINPLAPKLPSSSLSTSLDTNTTTTTTQARKDGKDPACSTNGRTFPNVAVGRVWAIWQAFQETGMKPDIVLLTTLMNVLAKAQQFDKADQIWETMMSLDRPLPSRSRDYKDSPLSKSSHQLHGSLNEGGGGSGSGSGGPNLETFSVLLQAYVAKNDVNGVAGVYQAIRRRQQQQQQLSSKHHMGAIATSTATTDNNVPDPSLRDVNTVLLNQILRLLVNVGEHKAAREIFDEMRQSALWKQAGWMKKGREGEGEEKDNHNISRTHNSAQGDMSSTEETAAPADHRQHPDHHHHHHHHHETFARRAYWRTHKTQRLQAWRKGRARPPPPQQEETFHPVAAENVVPKAGRTGPDAYTVEIMLQLARKEGDEAFETQLEEWMNMHGHSLKK
ncbi:hypothetical protein DFQ26_006420 [Actinomortierella ambigua]|nr:hypothetical protein DFQ26_006420 [Actinomortierella ambigua]